MSDINDINSATTDEPGVKDLLRVKKAKKNKKIEMEPFAIVEGDDGEETTLSIPKKVTSQVAVKYLRDIRNVGAEVAMSNAMYSLLGAETLEFIATTELEDDDVVERLMGEVRTRLMGAMEKIQGNG